MLVTIVEGNQKAPFSIATTLKYREGATPFPGICIYIYIYISYIYIYIYISCIYIYIIYIYMIYIYHMYIYIYHIYIYIYIIYIYIYHIYISYIYIGLMSRVSANGTGDRGSIPGRVTPKTQKMVLDQHYRVRIKGKVEQSREWNCALPYTKVYSYRKGSPRVTLD